MENAPNNIALTEYAHGAGCGCKIAPAVLQEILKLSSPPPSSANLLVGNETGDDAAVYQLSETQALISTTDFFTPIVDDAFSFGKIAAANAVSDVYAMGGKPILAIALLGWPVETLPAALAQRVLEGARATCAEAGIPLAGGHSIDSREPIFGLSVNGLVHPQHLKRNHTAKEGDYLFLTKPLGTGILSTAQKRKLLQPGDQDLWIAQLSRLNAVGAALGALEGVSSMTDVTGFGLLGHLMEIAQGATLSAELYYGRVPVLKAAKGYASQRVVPDATYRNWNAYSAQVKFDPGVNVMEAFSILPDPQTNGGLLFTAGEAHLAEVQQVLREHGYEQFTEPVGRMVAREEKVILVR